jgi:hypothetical protein
VVVIENAGGSGSSTAGRFEISWTQTTTVKLSSFKLFGYTGSAYNVTFELSRDGNFLGPADTVTGTNEFIFNVGIGYISNNVLTAGNYLLRIKGPNIDGNEFLNAGYNYNSTPTNTTNSAYGFSNATQTAVSTGQFLTYQLSAVPEPGTMLLGGIAAACGGAGAWWKRRKRPLLLPENPAID